MVGKCKIVRLLYFLVNSVWYYFFNFYLDTRFAFICIFCSYGN